MDPSVIAVALGGAVVTVTCVVTSFVMGKRAADAESKGGDARVKVAQLEGQLTIAEVTRQNETKRADIERRRADGLYDVLTKLRTRIGAGSDPRDFVLSLWADDTPPDPTSGVDSGTVPAGAAPKEPGPEDLIRPDDA